jgi:putative flippase GtrA
VTVRRDPKKMWIRWLKFNAVGGIGIGVQLAILAAFKSSLHVNYLLATALAVEVAVIHNFLWHERFTWADRAGGRSLLRFAKFNLTTGAFSIFGNLAAMKLLVGVLGLPSLAANGIAIVACSIVNFVVSNRVVFHTECKH